MKNENVDIILTSPPFSLKDDFGLLDFMGYYGPPTNLMYLLSSLEHSKIKTKLLDFSREMKSLKCCAEYLVSFNPRFIAVAVHFTFLSERSLQLISCIKELNSEITIIVGGVHFTAVPEETMEQCPDIDVGILGEAEEAIVKVVKTLQAGGNLKEINGIIFRVGKTLVKIGTNNMVENVNQLPFPPLDKIEYFLHSPAIYKKEDDIHLLIVTARGCPFHCTFCDRTVLGSKIRFYEIDYLSRLIDIFCTNYKITCFEINDENICITKKRFREICKLLKDKHQKYNFTWKCSIRADSVEPDTGKILYDSGCRDAIFGLESGSKKMLEVYNKKLNLDELPQKCKYIRSAGVRVSGSFIIGGPGENEETISETINLVKKTDLDVIFVWFLAPVPGSVIHKNLESTGKLIGDFSKRTGHYVTFIPNSSTKEQLEAGYKNIYRAFYSKPSVVYRTFKRYGLSGLPMFIKNGFLYVYRFIVKP